MAGKEGRYHHGDLRRALIGAALELVQQEGVAAMSLREVARRAGVTHAAPYRHFESREALLAAVAEEGFTELQSSLEGAASNAAHPAEALQATGIAYVRFAVDHPAHFRVMFGPGAAPCDHPSLAAASEGAFGVLVETISRCIEARVVVRRPPAELALAAWSMVHGLASLLVDGMLGGAGDPEALARGVTAHLFDGLAPR